MDINDNSVLEMLNNLIITERLNNSEILKMANLVSISDNLNELKENIQWECSHIKS